ncbi:MAG TPA: hypothetical protein VL404_00835 [Candidatus Eisenbacteria bacterium]|jgi:hypothetical protein|nr:hypothetical protein [Candidatus Eisenbacteria bacterium]
MNLNFSFANLAAGTLFGSIGFVAFVYGKKEAAWKPLVIGLVLMGYPFAVQDTTLLWVIGSALTASLYFFRD